eukprot:TRINITY_DN6836_c0_g1_i1.p1 TRINITY_DN6836_c0_g1~~TRINITY_DN6836_c0_g1_i1.p1  ORF type:complete len:281 (+),score=62.61 TRINITY_DN6836_c0_g1_i1:1650-2492(+)
MKNIPAGNDQFKLPRSSGIFFIVLRTKMADTFEKYWPSLYNADFPHIPVLVSSAALYLVVIFSLQSAVRAKKVTWVPNKFALVHNIILTVLSLWMFLECFYVSYKEGGFSGFTEYIQFPRRTTTIPRMMFVADIFYWSKFLELVDTVILVLRSRELSFLHLFHHCTTAAICYASRLGSVQVGVLTNSLVHFFMYLHFARPVPFLRKYLTTIQIVQFLYCIAYFSTYVFLGPPVETPLEIAWNYLCYLTFLAFFSHFFYENYITGAAAAKRKKVAPAKKAA